MAKKLRLIVIRLLLLMIGPGLVDLPGMKPGSLAGGTEADESGMSERRSGGSGCGILVIIVLFVIIAFAVVKELGII